MQNYRWTQEDFSMNPSDYWADYSWINPQIRRIYGLQKSIAQLSIQCNLCNCCCNKEQQKIQLNIQSKTVECNLLRDQVQTKDRRTRIQMQKNKRNKKSQESEQQIQRQLQKTQQDCRKNDSESDSDYQEVQNDILNQCKKAMGDLNIYQAKKEVVQYKQIQYQKINYFTQKVKNKFQNYDLQQIITICRQYDNSKYFHKSQKIIVINFCQSLSKILFQVKNDKKYSNRQIQGYKKQEQISKEAVKLWQFLEDNQQTVKQIVSTYRDAKTFNKQPRRQLLRIAKCLAQQLKLLS